MSALTSELIELAVTTSRAIQGLGSPKKQTDALKRHIELSEVFFGLVPDKDGGHMILIKGKELLQEIAAGDRAQAVIRGAIVVSCDEEAIAMRMVFGDGDSDLPPLH